MKKSLILVVMLVLFTVPVLSVETDEYYLSRMVDLVNEIPSITADECQARTEAGIDEVFSRVDKRLQALPWMFSVTFSSGIILAMVLGGFINMILFRHYRLKMLKLTREINNKLKGGKK